MPITSLRIQGRTYRPGHARPDPAKAIPAWGATAGITPEPAADNNGGRAPPPVKLTARRQRSPRVPHNVARRPSGRTMPPTRMNSDHRSGHQGRPGLGVTAGQDIDVPLTAVLQLGDARDVKACRAPVGSPSVPATCGNPLSGLARHPSPEGRGGGG